MADISDEEKCATTHVENELQHQYEPEHGMSTRQYIATRFSTLKPPMTVPPNPFRVLGLLKSRHWLFFAVSSECGMKSSLLTTATSVRHV
jgi:SHS family lactate transporter-like MFS transporter